MADHWDDIMKQLLRHNPQQFISWLLEEGLFTAELPVEIKRRNIYADALYKITLNGEPMLVEIEIQSTNKKLMPERLLEYNVQASRAHEYLPVLTCVIYLFDDGEVPEPPFVKTLPNGEEILRFNYICIELWKLCAEDIIQKGLIGLYPLLTLTADGKRPEVVDTMIKGIVLTDNKELLTLAYMLSSLVFKDADDQEKLKRSFAMLGDSILEKSWAFQEIKQQGREEGLKQGLQQGLQQERNALRKVLIGAVQAHYPAHVALASQKAQEISNPQVLQDAILKLLTARDENEVQSILLTMAPEAE